MSLARDLKKILIIPDTLHKKLGERVVRKSRKLLRSGKDVNDRPMPDYTEPYKTDKAEGTIKGSSSRFRSPNKFLSLSTNSMLDTKNFKLLKKTGSVQHRKGFAFGITNPKHAKKALYHSGIGSDRVPEKYRRPITGRDGENVVHSEIEEQILKTYASRLRKNLRIMKSVYKK